MFRGFSRRQARGGARRFRFVWLTPKPMVLHYEPSTATLVFENLLPEVERGSALLAAVEALVAGRSSRSLPAHRRIDRRRAEAVCSHRRGAVSLVVRAKGPHHGYAAQKGVHLVNEIFNLLHETYPEYLSAAFGLPSE